MIAVLEPTTRETMAAFAEAVALYRAPPRLRPQATSRSSAARLRSALCTNPRAPDSGDAVAADIAERPARDQHDRRPVAVGDALGRREAVDARQEHVDQHQVGLGGGEPGQRVLARLGLGDHEAVLCLEEPSRRKAEGAVVVDER